MDSKAEVGGTGKGRREATYELLILAIVILALSVITKPFIGNFESNIPISLRSFPEGRIPSQPELINIIKDNEREGKVFAEFVDAENFVFDERGLPKRYDVTIRVMGTEVIIRKDQGPGYNNLIYSLLLIANALLRLIVLLGGIKIFTGSSLGEVSREVGLRKIELKHILAAIVIIAPEFSQMVYTYIVNDAKSGAADLFTLIFLIVGPGIFEEIFFRGFIFGRLYRGGLHWFPAMVVTALASAVLHLTNLFLGFELAVVGLQLIFSTFVSLMMCYFLMKTDGNIWGLTLVHISVSSSIILSGLGVEALQSTALRNTAFVYTHWGTVLIWGYLVILLFFGRSKKDENPRQATVKA